MLYELIAVVRPGNLAEVKDIARQTGLIVLSSGGVVRTLQNWGVFALPRRTVRHQAAHTTGHYFLMRFDANAAAQDQVRRTLGLDPRMLRFSSVRLAGGNGSGRGARMGGLEGLAKAGGHADWNAEEQLARRF